jgi:hypothetical protein
MDEIWRKVFALEPLSRNAAPTNLPVGSSVTREKVVRGLFPVSHLLATKEV